MESGESVDTYFTALQSLYALLTLPHDDAALRSFLLMSQMVSGCVDPRVKEELLCLHDPTLERVLQALRGKEQAVAEVQAMSSAPPVRKASVTPPCKACG